MATYGILNVSSGLGRVYGTCSAVLRIRLFSFSNQYYHNSNRLISNEYIILHPYFNPITYLDENLPSQALHEVDSRLTFFVIFQIETWR